jgi:hypothetical protein
LRSVKKINKKSIACDSIWLALNTILVEFREKGQEESIEK